MAKQDHVLTGVSDTISGKREVAYYVDFTTGTGVGSAVLQCKIDGDWLPVSETYTATMDVVRTTSYFPGCEYRWSVTRSSGTIRTYIN